MRYIVARHIASAVRWYPPSHAFSRMIWEIREPVGMVKAVSFAHARKKAAVAYPAVEPQLLRVIIAD